MSTQENTVDANGKKWINTGVAATAAMVGYVMYRFFLQLSEWFELEARIPSYDPIAQGVAFTIAIIAFVGVLRHPVSSVFLQETYVELRKVVYPEPGETMSMSIKVMILVTIAGFALGLVDFLAGKGLSLLPSLS